MSKIKKCFPVLRRGLVVVLAAVILTTSTISAPASVQAAAVPVSGGLLELLSLLGLACGLFGDADSYHSNAAVLERVEASKKVPSLTVNDITYLCGNGKWQLTDKYASELQEILDSNVLSDSGRKEKIAELLSNAEKQAPTYSMLGELFRELAPVKNEITKKK